MTPAISVHGLAKRYRIRRTPYGRYGTDLADDLKTLLRHLVRGSWKRADYDDFWALRGVDFEVQPGEILGLVGRNGAGKSTLLKLLARVVRPSSGEALLHGRIGSLLEVGTGFHQDLTGRENVFLAGAILGLTRREIRSRFDEIVEFSDIERFLDTPVKRYSSGMYARLAFAVAAHLEADILLVDEVLAVGDAAFQRKCLGKMGDVARQGRTVVFVSHSMQAVQSMCTRCLWLQDGRIRMDGTAREVADAYFGSNSETCTRMSWSDPGSAPGDRDFRLASVSVRVAEDDGSDMPSMSDPVELKFDFWNLKDGNPVGFHVVFLSDEGIPQFRVVATPDLPGGGRPLAAGTWSALCRLPPHFLNCGFHRVQLQVARGRSDVFLTLDNLLRFEVREDRDDPTWSGYWPGAILPAMEWNVEPLT